MRAQLPTLLLSTLFALASPSPSLAGTSTSTGIPTATVIPPASYYLRSRVVGVDKNNNDSDKDGLYVCNYRTGNIDIYIFALFVQLFTHHPIS